MTMLAIAGGVLAGAFAAMLVIVAWRLWDARARRRVWVHLADKAGETTVEGVITRRWPHWRIEGASIIQMNEAGEISRVKLDADWIEPGPGTVRMMEIFRR